MQYLTNRKSAICNENSETVQCRNKSKQKIPCKNKCAISNSGFSARKFVVENRADNIDIRSESEQNDNYDNLVKPKGEIK